MARTRTNGNCGCLSWTVKKLRCLSLASLVVLSFTFSGSGPRAGAQGPPPIRRDRAAIDSLPRHVHLVDHNDIRFRRLSGSADLSQTRAAWIVQDRVGFLWFGTQYGLNRFDGYKSKTFKHEPGRPESLSCVYIRSLFVDHSGSLWVGCDRYLDRFEPLTETFAHYRIFTDTSDEVSTPVDRINEDRAGILWLSTAKGLYRFDPTSGGTRRYVHDSRDPTSIADTRINMAGEDREGRFWVASGGGLDLFNRETGRVITRAPQQGEITRFYEDESGLFWLAGGDAQCQLATWNPRIDPVHCHTLDYSLHGTKSRAQISAFLEAHDGTLWLSSTAGLLKFEPNESRIIRYHNNPLDTASLESDQLISIFEDAERNIWTCFQGVEPNFFSEEPPPFASFTYQRGNLLDPLVTSIYEDSKGILWIGSMGGLNGIDRRSGTNISMPRVGNEILSILEDGNGVLFGGTFHEGLRQINRASGALSPYPTKGSISGTYPIVRLIYAHDGTMWAAMYGGIGHYDPKTRKFIMFTPDNRNTIQYQEIKEDKDGFFWLGAQSGLHRFDPRTGQFKIYEHHQDDPKSLSDNRVNSLLLDHLGALWIGTQDGLDRFDRLTGTFKNYHEKDGLAGGVVSCVLQDRHGILWMSTNRGLSRFDPQSGTFRTFSAADGLSGQDLTGWGACHQSPSGEMFFGGFSGVTAFYPEEIAHSTFVPRTVLTDFRLSGSSVVVGRDEALKQSLASTDSITLSNKQNFLSIEFSTLSYSNAATNRYRYKLDGLDTIWHEAGSDQRIANYTTLPAATYTFEVQGATSRGPWSAPALLHIKILPAWYQTLWFRTMCVVAVLILLWFIFWLRLSQLHRAFNMALEARVDERTRIARELHDTLLQSFNGLLLRFQSAANMLPARPEEARKRIESAIEQASIAITEGRDAVHELRSGALSTLDLSQALSSFANELLSGSTQEAVPQLHVEVEGTPRSLNPLVRDELYRAGAEALRNAIRHANAQQIEVEIRYDSQFLRLRIRDDGRGIDPVILGQDHRTGHWGLRGMRERAKLVGGTCEIWSQVDGGTEIDLSIPAATAYAKMPTSQRLNSLRLPGDKE